MLDARAPLLRAALGFLSLEPREPELQLLHRCSTLGAESAMSWPGWRADIFTRRSQGVAGARRGLQRGLHRRAAMTDRFRRYSAARQGKRRLTRGTESPSPKSSGGAPATRYTDLATAGGIDRSALRGLRLRRTRLGSSFSWGQGAERERGSEGNNDECAHRLLLFARGWAHQAGSH
jgi:hypothetical protein